MRKDKNMEKGKNKITGVIAIVMAVGILAASATSYAAYVNAQQRDVHADLERQSQPINSPMDVAKTIKQQNPEAEISQGMAAEILMDVPLEKIAGQSVASRPDQFDPRKSLNDTGVGAELYFVGNSNGIDTVAISIKNANQKAIFITGLVVSGFVRGDFPGSAIESVYRPVISDPFDVVGATTTIPQLLRPGESITAYIQDELNAEGYGALVCYSYVAPPASDGEQSDVQQFEESRFCISLPLTWIK